MATCWYWIWGRPRWLNTRYKQWNVACGKLGSCPPSLWSVHVQIMLGLFGNHFCFRNHFLWNLHIDRSGNIDAMLDSCWYHLRFVFCHVRVHPHPASMSCNKGNRRAQITPAWRRTTTLFSCWLKKSSVWSSCWFIVEKFAVTTIGTLCWSWIWGRPSWLNTRYKKWNVAHCRAERFYEYQLDIGTSAE